RIQTQDSPDGTVEATMNYPFEFIFEVISSNSDEMLLEITFDKISYKAETSVGPRDRDVSDLIGHKARFKLKNNGEVYDFQGLEELPPIEIERQMKADKQYYMNFITNLFPVFSENSVNINDTWTDKKVEESKAQGPDGKQTTTYNYSFKILEEVKKDGYDCLKIERQTTITIKGTGEMSGYEFINEESGNGTETIYFAYKKGLVSSIETSVKSEGTVNLDAAGVSVFYTRDTKSTTSISFEK
ncbi:hypothetical protein ACFL4T_05205, partial [candidate division KSB1 bacterium]